MDSMSVDTPENPYPDATPDSLCSVCGGFVLNRDGIASACRLEMRDAGDGAVELRILLHQPPWKQFYPKAEPQPDRYYRRG